MTEQEAILLRVENVELKRQVAALTEKVNLLLELLNKPITKKDSHNSSLPPSSDLFGSSKNKSLRTKSFLQSGGQPGHKGKTLEMRSEPDKITELKSNYCRNCGASLEDIEQVLKARRQVIELPPIQPIYEEFRQYGCTCSKCGQEQVADFPKGVNAPIQYGSTIEALVCYLSVYQYVPFARLQNLFGQVFSLPLSQGTVGNILQRASVKCAGVYQIIKSKIAESEVVGSDETGAKVNGAKWWIWVWQNIQNTFIVASPSRGAETIDNVWGKGLSNKLSQAVLVTDRWAAQLKSMTKAHQICLAHLLRNVIFLEESENHSFAVLFRQFIVEIFNTQKELIKLNTSFSENDSKAKATEKKLNELLAMSVDKEKYPNTLIFQASMIKCRNSLTPCLYNLDIPPDNNGSERAIRNIKVKQKISGQFKSGQNAFCVIRSVIDTLRKRNVQILPSLNLIIKLQPV